MPDAADRVPRGRRTSARQRAAQRRAAEAAAAARRRRRTLVVATAVALGLAALVTITVMVQGGRTAIDAAAPTPAHTVADGTAFRVGSPGAPVTVRVYEDFLCPVCRQFEESSTGTLQELVDEGTIQVHYAPIAILDHASTDEYSTRALNAVAVVADEAGTETFRAFHDLLFRHQPAEGGPGLTDDQLIALAREAGATGESVAAGIRGARFVDWSARVTDEASRLGVRGTPTVLVDGRPVTDWTPDGLRAAIRAAAADS